LPAHFPRLANPLMHLGLLSHQPIDDVRGKEHFSPQYLLLARQYGPKWKEAWRVTQVLISQLEKEAKNHGSNLAVISIPFREQVYENLWKWQLSKPGMGQREWDLNKPDRILAGFLTDAGIPFLQLLPHFRKAAEESQLYYQQDGHWNINGHHLAGQLIYEWLVEEELIPG
jgi:hypothetical protein